MTLFYLVFGHKNSSGIVLILFYFSRRGRGK
jgi:hypothetical protein